MKTEDDLEGTVFESAAFEDALLGLIREGHRCETAGHGVHIGTALRDTELDLREHRGRSIGIAAVEEEVDVRAVLNEARDAAEYGASRHREVILMLHHDGHHDGWDAFEKLFGWVIKEHFRVASFRREQER